MYSLFLVAHIAWSQWADAGTNIKKLTQGWEGGDFCLTAYQMTVDGTPYDPAKDQANIGPSNYAFKYSSYHRFFPVKNSAGDEGVVWQEFGRGACYITWHKQMNSVRSVNIPCRSKEAMTGCTHNSQDAIVCVGITHADGQGRYGVNGAAISNIRVFKIKMSDGSIIKERNLPLSSNQFDAIAVTPSMASLKWDVKKNKIGILLASEANSRHYSGRSASFDADSLETKDKVRQTAGHSWAHSITLLDDGQMWVVDACDNYARGLSISSIGGSRGWGHRSTRLPYRYKQKQGDNNDNNVYTELAHKALVNIGDRVALVFSGEGVGHHSYDGPQGTSHNEAYNLAVVVMDNKIDGTTIYSQGKEEHGTFTDYGGKVTSMKHKGVTWLTNRSGLDNNVSRVKTFRAGKNIVIMYEVWKKNSFGGSVMILAIDHDGKIVIPEVEIPASFGVRLTRVDDVESFDGKKAVFYRGDSGKLVRFELWLCSAPPPSTGSSSPETEKAPPSSPGTAKNPPRSPGTAKNPPRSPGTEKTPPRSPETEKAPPRSPGTGKTPPRSPGTGKTLPSFPRTGKTLPSSPETGKTPASASSPGTQKIPPGTTSTEAAEEPGTSGSQSVEGNDTNFNTTPVIIAGAVAIVLVAGVALWSGTREAARTKTRQTECTNRRWGKPINSSEKRTDKRKGRE